MNSDSSVGVIFDMDGVLIDSAAPHLRSWQLLAQECGGTVTEEAFARTFGRQNRDIIPIMFGQVSDARMRALADRKEEIYRDLIRARPPIVDGAVELVRGLYEAGARLAVGSSGPRDNIELVIASMNVADCISVIVSGDDVTRGKPDPQVFSLAADRLGIEPERCVVIEDAPVGVQAARAAGARTIAVLLYHPAEALEDADCVVLRLADLAAEKVVSLVHR
ncbi:MAG: HAD family phosphatase [Phycisphaerae bacterium]